ncbi:GGDEF domain-containing protein [uncultured Sphaerochaeta sp.]|uniref:sensor domain-containing diguanylate cyclase n=1 Tax=uncultured Sphaerochaeta sp. TaxID=886478 RepID=UPI002A0A5326|nr:GGDEF domain-containing protein [uncultured Sphaerochaeta sp.]
MIRLTKKVFSDLAIWMMGFGLIVGLVFPFFMFFLGIPREITFSWWFFLVCMIAGLFVGFVNIILAKRVVGSRLSDLSNHMLDIEKHLKDISGKSETFDCSPLKCHIPVDSEDAIGESSKAFNNLVDTLAKSMQTEINIRTYTQMLTSHLETDELCRDALVTLLDMVKAPAGAILVEEEGELNVHCSVGLTNADSLGANPLVLDTLQTLRRGIIDIPKNITLDGVLTTFQPQQIIVEPILYKKVGLGIIVLASPFTFAEESYENLDLFGKSLALALHNSMAHDQVQRLAAVDPLTGVYNRRFGVARLHEEFIRTVKQNISMGLLMMDIDNFKQINDAYGHSVGDRVLRSIALTARGQLREGDIIVRLGGDEFMLVLLGASRSDTQDIGEKIRRMVDEKRISYGEQNIHATVSIGGSSFPELDAEYEKELIEAADRSLYLVKNSGRNRVSV